ncbi:MAG: hypothetical protein QM796_08565 [Chthoniobacteraceae bacterium]
MRSVGRFTAPFPTSLSGRHLYAASLDVPEERILALHVRAFVAGFAGLNERARAFEAAAFRGAPPRAQQMFGLPISRQFTT